MNKKISTHLHGSPEVWNDVYQNLDLSYTEKATTSGKLFELVKINFLEEIFPKAPQKMLEVGCGTAFVSLYFAKRGYATTCLDINKSILEVAQTNFKKEGVQGKFVVGGAEKLPFADNSFNIVTSFGLLEHFVDPTIVITEMVRIIKPGGIFFADIVPNRFSVQTIGNIFNSLFVVLFYTLKMQPSVGFKKASKYWQPPYFENSLSWRQYQQIIQSAHIKDVAVRGNRPFPRLTLPKSLDQVYTSLLKLKLPFWRTFDRWDHPLPRFWGAGWWFWGEKR